MKVGFSFFYLRCSLLGTGMGFGRRIILFCGEEDTVRAAWTHIDEIINSQFPLQSLLPVPRHSINSALATALGTVSYGPVCETESLFRNKTSATNS